MGLKMQIHGKTILGFPVGNNEIEQYSCDFCLIEDSHDFIMEVEEYPIEKACDLLFSNEAIHRDYLFCIDENNVCFTIYDCFIIPMQIPVKQMRIIWNKCIVGYHIANLDDEKIISAEYIIQTDKKKYPFHMFVGKNEFDVLNGMIHISTSWNQVDSKYEGVTVSVHMKEPVSISLVESIVLRLLEIYSLQMGFFPKVVKRKMITTSQTDYYLLEEFAAYGKTSKKNIKMDYVLNTQNDIDFSEIYNKWWELREKEVVTFNLFSYLTTESSPVREVPIATCIQCLEGYFRIHHAENVLKFTKDAKKKIKEEVLKALDTSDGLLKVCVKHGVEYENIRKSFEGMLGHINEYSLRDILLYAIERCNVTKKLFEYEMKTEINEKSSMLDLFIQKATGHRNWLSHLVEQSKRFVDNEIELANQKLRMLFRLTLLYDIGLEVTDTSLNNVIKKINRWYEKNELL